MLTILYSEGDKNNGVYVEARKWFADGGTDGDIIIEYGCRESKYDHDGYVRRQDSVIPSVYERHSPYGMTDAEIIRLAIKKYDELVHAMEQGPEA